MIGNDNISESESKLLGKVIAKTDEFTSKND